MCTAYQEGKYGAMCFVEGRKFDHILDFERREQCPRKSSAQPEYKLDAHN